MSYDMFNQRKGRRAYIMNPRYLTKLSMHFTFDSTELEISNGSIKSSDDKGEEFFFVAVTD